MPQKLLDQGAFFISGCDSRNDPAFISQTGYAWGINGTPRGGIFRTRPGFTELLYPPALGVLTDLNMVQAITVFTPLNDLPNLVIAHGGKIYRSPYPFIEFTQLSELSFWPYSPIEFEVCVKSLSTNPDGTVTAVNDPYPVLIIQDGISRAGYWDGKKAAHERKIQTGLVMRWSGQRLWVGEGHRLHASNLSDPLNFSDDKGLTGSVGASGFFTLPDEITAIGQTPDLRALLVWTDDTTTTFQSSVLDRSQWPLINDFQKLLFLSIGCVGPKAWFHQYGMTWWMSHNGVVNLDLALQTYRSSRITYRDYPMSRSRSTLSPNLRNVCAGSYENCAFFAVPSGDRYNSHIWVLEHTPIETAEPAPAAWAGIWKGIRPAAFVTAVVNGVNRCFALSRDYAADPVGANYRLGIWELFCPQRADVSLDGTVKRIKWGFESRQMAFSGDPKKITAVEWDLAELRGEVDVTMFYNGRRSAFIPIGEKHIVATVSTLGGGPSYLSQQRVIRSEEIRNSDPNIQSVQSKTIRSIDRGFGTYLEGEGEAAVCSVRVFGEAQPDAQIGRCEDGDDQEETQRTVTVDGVENLSGDMPIPPFAHRSHSVFTDTLSQRYPELSYASR